MGGVRTENKGLSRPESGHRAADESQADTFRLAVGGDLLGPYGEGFSVDSASDVAEIFSSADAGFANHEGNAFSLSDFGGSVAAENGGGYPLHTPRTMRELRAFGISLLSRANNHATDWGLDGLRASDETTSAAGFLHAGTGGTLEEARRASCTTVGKTKVALVAAASSFTPMSPAGHPARGAGGRPGLSPLRVQPVAMVLPSDHDAMKGIAAQVSYLGYGAPARNDSDIRVGELLYRRSSKSGLTYDVNEKDRQEILASIATAKSKNDLVIFSIHAHETATGDWEDPVPAAFLLRLFHEVIDAGADVVVRHGPHTVGAIDVYKGRPIFHSMGSLFLDLNRRITIASEGPESTKLTIELPDAWYESAVFTIDWADNAPVSVAIRPVRLGAEEGPHRGLPTLAEGDEARRILDMIAQLSAGFGQNMRHDGLIGRVDLQRH